MHDIDDIVNKLENSIRQTERELHSETANMPKGNSDSDGKTSSVINTKYLLIAIPILVLLVLYLVKPKFVLKDSKSKNISVKHFIGYTVGITFIFYALIFLLVKCGYLTF